MKNREIAKVFYELADYLQMGEAQFRPYAYRKAALSLESMEKDVEEFYKEGGIKALEEIPGVGKSIAEKIEEYLKTGKIKHHERFKKRMPLRLEEITGIEGMGPKKAKILYRELGVRNLKSLEEAARKHKIASLEGFGEKTEENIIEGIEFLKKSRGRFLLGEIVFRAREMRKKLESLDEVEKIDVAGSFRRKKETIGDVDILVFSKKPEKVVEFFVSQKEVTKVWGKGSTKSSVRVEEGFDIDLRVVSEKSYGSALLYFTGSKEHNIALRKIAMGKGMKLSEYGLFKGKKVLAGKTEKGVYNALGMNWIAPEMRENRGEVEAALKGKLPDLVEYRDILGDLHIHSSWDGGQNSIGEIAEAARKMGYRYAGISDHTKFLKIEHGLDEKELARRNKKIDALNSQRKDFRILKGAETNILNDGSIDINDKALSELDYAIAGIHSNFGMPEKEMTERIIKAMKNPYIRIISHPTGRILKRRDGYRCDLDKILRAAREFGTVLEINSHPERLDLNDQNIKRAKEAGVKMVVSTDSHQNDQLRYMELGIAQARRGWAEKKDIINTMDWKEILKFFGKKSA